MGSENCGSRTVNRRKPVSISLGKGRMVVAEEGGVCACVHARVWGRGGRADVRRVYRGCQKTLRVQWSGDQAPHTHLEAITWGFRGVPDGKDFLPVSVSIQTETVEVSGPWDHAEDRADLLRTSHESFHARVKREYPPTRAPVYPCFPQTVSSLTVGWNEFMIHLLRCLLCRKSSRGTEKKKKRIKLDRYYFEKW